MLPNIKLLGCEECAQSDDLLNEVRQDPRFVQYLDGGDSSDTDEESFKECSSSEDDLFWKDIERCRRMGPGMDVNEFEASKGISRLPYPIIKDGQFTTVVTPQIDICPKLHTSDSR